MKDTRYFLAGIFQMTGGDWTVKLAPLGRFVAFRYATYAVKSSAVHNVPRNESGRN